MIAITLIVISHTSSRAQWMAVIVCWSTILIQIDNMFSASIGWIAVKFGMNFGMMLVIHSMFHLVPSLCKTNYTKFPICLSCGNANCVEC